MGKQRTLSDKILYAVLSDEHLMAYGEYSFEDIQSMDFALASDNAIVKAVAMIIDKYRSDNYTEKEIYKAVKDLLTKEL